MKLNVGSTDRLIRIIAGIVLIALGFFVMGGTWGIVLGVLGIVFLVTGLVRFCPLYIPFKISTNK